jgi:hypothetical protein
MRAGPRVRSLERSRAGSHQPSMSSSQMGSDLGMSFCGYVGDGRSSAPPLMAAAQFSSQKGSAGVPWNTNFALRPSLGARFLPGVPGRRFPR